MCFRGHDISASAHVEGEKNSVSLPPMLNTHKYRHTHIHTQIFPNTNILLSFQHQSSDMFNHMSLYVTHIVGPVLSSPPVLYITAKSTKEKAHEP